MIKNVKLAELNTKIASAFFLDLIEYKCLFCKKNDQKNVDGNLKKRFFNTHKFSYHDIIKFILFLRKSVYPYEYIDGWEKYSKTSLFEKEDFHGHVNTKDITAADYAHGKRVCKDFKEKI